MVAQARSLPDAPTASASTPPAGKAKPSGSTIFYAPTIAQPLDPPRFLSGAWGLTSGRPVGLTGVAGSTKTLLAQDLALSVAKGDSYCWGDAMSLELRGRVIHLDYEMGKTLLWPRYQRLAYGRGIDLAKLGKSLGVINYPKLKLTSDEAVTKLRQLCDGVALCLIDSLRAACPGVDENDSNMRTYLDTLSEVSDETGTVFLVIHHDGKGAEDKPTMHRMRGSSAIADALGSSLAVSEQKGDTLVEHAKASYGRKKARVRVRLEDVGDYSITTYTHQGLRFVAVDEAKANAEVRAELLAKTKESALAAIRVHGPLGYAELRKKMVGAQDLRDIAINELLAAGALVRPPGAAGTKRPIGIAKVG